MNSLKYYSETPITVDAQKLTLKTKQYLYKQNGLSINGEEKFTYYNCSHSLSLNSLPQLSLLYRNTCFKWDLLMHAIFKNSHQYRLWHFKINIAHTICFGFQSTSPFRFDFCTNYLIVLLMMNSKIDHGGNWFLNLLAALNFTFGKYKLDINKSWTMHLPRKEILSD